MASAAVLGLEDIPPDAFEDVEARLHGPVSDWGPPTRARYGIGPVISLGAIESPKQERGGRAQVHIPH